MTRAAFAPSPPWPPARRRPRSSPQLGANVPPQPGRFAGLAGGSDGVQMEHLTPAPADFHRGAWLVGGNGHAEMVYGWRRRPIGSANKRAAVPVPRV